MDQSIQLDLAAAAIETGDFTRAVELLGPLVEGEPENPIYRALRAEAHLLRGDLENAEIDAAMAVRADPRNPDIHHLVAQVCVRAGQVELARKAFSEAVRLSGPADPFLLAEFAFFLAEQHFAGEAEPLALQAVELAPQSADAWAALCLTHTARGHLAEAQSALARAKELAPDALSVRTAGPRLQDALLRKQHSDRPR